MFAMLALLVVGKGVTTLARGRIVYYNYRGLVVYAPFAVVVGVGFLLRTIVL